MLCDFANKCSSSLRCPRCEKFGKYGTEIIPVEFFPLFHISLNYTPIFWFSVLRKVSDFVGSTTSKAGMIFKVPPCNSVIFKIISKTISLQSKRFSLSKGKKVLLCCRKSLRDLFPNLWPQETSQMGKESSLWEGSKSLWPKHQSCVSWANSGLKTQIFHYIKYINDMILNNSV